MDSYSLINLFNGNIEDKIKEAINKTKIELSDLTTDRTCIIYTNYLYKNLKDVHVLAHIICTADIGLDYFHQFIMVPASKNQYYIADLTYSQFGEEEYLKGLYENGYQKLNGEEFDIYMNKISGTDNTFDLDSVFMGKTGSIKRR